MHMKLSTGRKKKAAPCLGTNLDRLKPRVGFLGTSCSTLTKDKLMNGGKYLQMIGWIRG